MQVCTRSPQSVEGGMRGWVWGGRLGSPRDKALVYLKSGRSMHCLRLRLAIGQPKM